MQYFYKSSQCDVGLLCKAGLEYLLLCCSNRISVCMLSCDWYFKLHLCTHWVNIYRYLMLQPENVAIANALHLRPPEPLQPFPASLRRRANFEVAERINCCVIAFLLLIHYFTPWPWPLTFDLEHLQRIICDEMKLCTKFERNRTIRGGVIVSSVFDLMILRFCSMSPTCEFTYMAVWNY